jgi:hypothetical protein
LRWALKSQRFNHDVDAWIVQHVFSFIGKKRGPLREPFFALRTARIDFSDNEIDVGAHLALEVVKQNVLDRFADDSRTEQTDADLATFVHGCQNLNPERIGELC